ncbi:MAG: hypothetical protein R6V53_01465, partial [Candidatus Woesearchaeota archaeon]
NITPENPTASDDLSCYANITGASDIVNVSFTWYVNDTHNTTWDTTIECNHSELCYTDRNVATLIYGWNYTCQAYAYDNEFTSDAMNSSTVVVGNSAPTIDLILPEHNLNISKGTDLTNRTPLMKWNATDAEGDTLSFQINISCYPACSDDNRFYTLGSENYTKTSINYSWVLSEELEYLWDGEWGVEEYYYTWQIRAYDGAAYSNWSESFNMSVASLIQFVLEPNTINFSEAELWESRSTLDPLYPPIVIINDGNINANVSMLTTQYLWASVPPPSRYFQFRIDESETGSFNATNSIMEWTNVSLDNVSILHDLDYHDEYDSAELHFNITVPPAEPEGSKQANITISGRPLFR